MTFASIICGTKIQIFAAKGLKRLSGADVTLPDGIFSWPTEPNPLSEKLLWYLRVQEISNPPRNSTKCWHENIRVWRHRYIPKAYPNQHVLHPTFFEKLQESWSFTLSLKLLPMVKPYGKTSVFPRRQHPTPRHWPPTNRPRVRSRRSPRTHQAPSHRSLRNGSPWRYKIRQLAVDPKQNDQLNCWDVWY